MSSALTFYFKDIFKDVQTFTAYITEYDIANMKDAESLTFAQYLFKILFRRFHNSNIQYDTPEDFKCDLANILEDSFDQYKRQKQLIDKLYTLTDDELLQVSTALANSANNPNSTLDDPTKPIEYVGAQVYSIASNGKLSGYLTALRAMPTKFIGEIIDRCTGLFKRIVPDQIYIFEGEKINDFDQ